MSTIELKCYPSETLTATIYEIGSTSPLFSGLALTEQSRPGRYRCSVELAVGEWYDVVVFDENNVLMADWQVFVQPSGVSYCEEMPHAVWERIAEQVASGPVTVSPAVVEDTETAAWCLCRDAHGAPLSGVTVELIALTADKPWLSNPSATLTAASSSYGVAQFVIPRAAGMKFRASVQPAGIPAEFVGVDAESLRMPDLFA